MLVSSAGCSLRSLLFGFVICSAVRSWLIYGSRRSAGSVSLEDGEASPSVMHEDAATWNNKDTVLELLSKYKAFLFDCDGTLYSGGTAFSGVTYAIRILRQLGKKVFFVTNTARSAKSLAEKLWKLGVPAMEDECIPSSMFTADYIKTTHYSGQGAGGRFYVIGGQGLADELKRKGLQVSGAADDNDKSFDDKDFGSMAEQVKRDHYDGVVIGFDNEINFYKIAKASLVFQLNPRALFYATNPDSADRVQGYMLPDTGPLIKAVESACEAVAHNRTQHSKPQSCSAQILGKPNPLFAKYIAGLQHIHLNESVMVGDRLDTDIQMGILAAEAGEDMGTLFVQTGVDNLAQIKKKDIKPKYVLPSVFAIGDVCMKAQLECEEANAKSGSVAKGRLDQVRANADSQVSGQPVSMFVEWVDVFRSFVAQVSTSWSA